MKLKELKQDAFVFEFTDPKKLSDDHPFCIGIALNNANKGERVKVQLNLIQ
jgi:hypothetical protein